MSLENQIEFDCPDDLGTDLVNILYKNTTLSYNACSQNIIEIFEYLSQKIPKLENLSENLVKSIKVSLCLLLYHVN